MTCERCGEEFNFDIEIHGADMSCDYDESVCPLCWKGYKVTR